MKKIKQSWYIVRRILIKSGVFTATDTHTYGRDVEMVIENLGDDSGGGFILVMNAQKAGRRRKWWWNKQQ